MAPRLYAGDPCQDTQDVFNAVEWIAGMEASGNGESEDYEYTIRYRVNSFMASPMPDKVSGYMRWSNRSLISAVDWV